MRLFIGLPLPAEQASALERHLAPWRTSHPELKWVASGQVHWTLQFLGDVEEARLPGLREALASLSGQGDFELELGRAFAMPPGVRARVLALDLVQGAEPLCALAARVASVTGPLGFPPEDRPFKAHLTLARVRQGERLRLDPAAIGAPGLPAFRAASFHLYQSTLRPQGPLYRSLLEVKLAPPER